MRPRPRRPASLLLPLAAALCLAIASPSGAQAPASLVLELNQTTYRPGDVMTLTVTMTPGSTVIPVDAYIVAQAPDGSYFSLQANGSVVAGLVPIASNFFPLTFHGEVARFLLDSSVPTGGYTWFAAITHAGTLDVIGAIDDWPFLVTHDPVPVPVPPTLALLAAGVAGAAGLSWYRRRRRGGASPIAR